MNNLEELKKVGVSAKDLPAHIPQHVIDGYLSDIEGTRSENSDVRRMCRNRIRQTKHFYPRIEDLVE